MDDNLTEILKYFSLRARTFHAGPLCRSANFDVGNELGYIHVLRTGTLTVTNSDNSSISLSEPSLIFYMNPTIHRLSPVTTDINLVCASFDFGNSLKNPLLQALPETIILKLSEVPSLNTSLQLLFSEANDNHLGQQPLLNKLFEVIIIQLLRELIDQKYLQTGLLAGLAEPRLAKAILAIHTEPAKSWTLDNLAFAAGMSRTRFAAKFRETVGITPGHYLNDWRIGIAQSLLRSGESLQRVTDAVGYANTSALSRAFKAAVGTSPTRWKKQN